MSDPLAGTHAKIDRAHDHILEFNRQIVAGAANLRPEPLRASRQIQFDNANSGILSDDYVFSVRTDPPPIPLPLALIAAEAIYHLRSALDHLIFQLVIHKTKKERPDFNSAFPIVGKGRTVKNVWRTAAEEYEAQTSRLKQDLSVDAQTLLENVQPFKRGAAYAEDPLWILGELNNTDKHRLIPLAVHAISEYTVTVTSAGQTMNVRFAPPPRYERDAEIGRIRAFGNDSDVRVDGDLVLEIAFAEVCGREYVPVVPLLAQLRGHVKGIVDAFTPEFGRWDW